jgi:hypothetical protein
MEDKREEFLKLWDQYKKDMIAIKDSLMKHFQKEIDIIFNSFVENFQLRFLTKDKKFEID